jgi:hypothetical protein
VSGLVSVVFVFKSSSKMVAPLSNCTLVEQRAVIHFLRSEDVVTSEIYRRMLVQYGEQCMAQKIYTSGWTDLNVGGQLLLMKNNQVGLQHHEQMTTMLKWVY